MICIICGEVVHYLAHVQLNLVLKLLFMNYIDSIDISQLKCMNYVLWHDLTRSAFLPYWTPDYYLFQQLGQMLIILGCLTMVDRLSSCIVPHAVYSISGKPFWPIFPTYGPPQPFCAHTAQVFRPFLLGLCQIWLSYTIRLVKVTSLFGSFFLFFH